MDVFVENSKAKVTSTIAMEAHPLPQMHKTLYFLK